MLIENIKEAFQNLLSNKMRSLLTSSDIPSLTSPHHPPDK